jgi:hypothetical protein
MRCKHCGHHKDAHPACRDCVQCGCVRFAGRDPAARQARLRTFVAVVEFFVKNRWIRQEVRVRALGHAGAALRSVQSAKSMALTRGTRVLQVKVTMTPVPRSRSRNDLRCHSHAEDERWPGARAKRIMGEHENIWTRCWRPRRSSIGSLRRMLAPCWHSARGKTGTRMQPNHTSCPR